MRSEDRRSGCGRRTRRQSKVEGQEVRVRSDDRKGQRTKGQIDKNQNTEKCRLEDLRTQRGQKVRQLFWTGGARGRRTNGPGGRETIDYGTTVHTYRIGPLKRAKQHHCHTVIRESIFTIRTDSVKTPKASEVLEESTRSCRHGTRMMAAAFSKTVNQRG